jgi:hypothetical protein
MDADAVSVTLLLKIACPNLLPAFVGRDFLLIG